MTYRVATIVITLTVAMCLLASNPSAAGRRVQPTQVGAGGGVPSLLPPAAKTHGAPQNTPLAIGAPALTPNVIDAGQQLNLSVSISGGYQPYNITWLGLPYGCPSENKTKFHCFPGAPSGRSSDAEVSVQVVDTAGGSATSNASVVTVNPDPTVAIDINPASAGVPPFFVNFTAIPTGGTPPFQYSWSFGDGGVGEGASIEHEYSSTGTFSVTVWGNDSFGKTGVGHAKVRSVTLPSVLLSITPLPTVSQGSDVTLSVTSDGGLGPFTFQWTGLPSFCVVPTGLNNSTISCTNAVAGVYTVKVLATDSLQQTAMGTITLTVTAPASFWEYVAVGFLAIAVVLAVVVAFQIARYRRERRPPPALQPVGGSSAP